MARQWGLLCPEGHGLLIEREDWTTQGVSWCPHSDHDVTEGTSGRMYRRQEVAEGWFDPDKPHAKTAVQVEIEARVAEREVERQEAWRMATAEKAKTKKPRAERVAKVVEPKDCMCGCGGQTKGGRFIPGHDARFHSRVKALVAFDSDLSHEQAEAIASKGPLTGKYAAAQQPKAKAVKAPKAEKPKAAKATAAVAEAAAVADDAEAGDAPAVDDVPDAPAESGEEAEPVIA